VGETVNRAALVGGAFFIVAGVLFLLDRIGAFDLELRVVAPILLITLGAAVLLGGRRPAA
jgi:hypothetical protein